MFCNFWVIFLKMKAFEADTFSSLSTQPVNSIFSVIVRIYKIHVIEKAFFLFATAPMKSEKVSFSYFLGKQWNKLFQQNYAADHQSKLSLNNRVKSEK